MDSVWMPRTGGMTLHRVAQNCATYFYLDNYSNKHVFE